MKKNREKIPLNKKIHKTKNITTQNGMKNYKL